MIFISKGKLYHQSTDRLLIHHFGGLTNLSGIEAEIWLSGRHEFQSVRNDKESKAVDRLVQLRMAECENANSSKAKFWMLRRCILKPVKSFRFSVSLSRLEKTILIWLKKAGIYLNIAELVYLIENDIQPTEDLLYERNRLVLSRTIYKKTVSVVYELEHRMAHAICLYEVIRALLSLVRKKRIVLY